MVKRIGVVVVWLVVCVIAAAAQQSPASAPAGLITGRVVDAGTDKPLASVIVEIASDAAAAGARKQVTNAQGRFAFRQLPAGRYTIRATASGNIPSPNGFIQNSSGFPIGAYLGGGFGQQTPNGPLRVLVLADGQRVGSADIRLWRGSVIAGAVTDDTGDPLVDVIVGAVRVSSDGRLTNGPTARTDDLGRYRLSALEPGRYVVFVPQTQQVAPMAAVDAVLARMQTLLAAQPPGTSMPTIPQLVGVRVGDALMSTMPQGMISGALAPRVDSGAVLAFPTTFYPSATALDTDSGVVVNAGEERSGIDVTVRPVRTANLSGTLSVSGVPVPTMPIHLLPAGAGDASLFEVATGATDPAGHFTFPAIPTGAYTIVVEGSPAPPLPPPPGAVMHSSGALGGPGAWLSQPVTVGPEGVSGLALTLRPGLSLRGRVEFDGLSPKPDETRMRGVRVSVTSARPKLRSPDPPAQGAPDPAGDFAAIGFSAGRYTLQASYPQSGPWLLKSITVNGRDVAEWPIDITEDLSGVVVTFTDRAASVVATVSNARESDGAAGVVLFPADRSVWRDLRTGSTRLRNVVVSTSGDASMLRVLPGDYLAAAIPASALADFPDVALLNALAPLATSVRVTAGETATVALPLQQVRR
jgi:hypothetical protein